MGTPEFAVPTLLALIDSKYKPVLIISQPDKPSGRNLHIKPTPVKEVALKYNIPCFQPEDINAKDSISHVATFNPHVLITAAYGAYLKKSIRTMAKHGALNLHPSLLPLHRGADPVRSTLLAGDSLCGITFFIIKAKMDTGPIIHQVKYDIPKNYNYSKLENYLSEKGGDEIIFTVERIFNTDPNEFKEQDHELATYSSKVEKNVNLIDFNLNFRDFINKLKGYSDEPGYFCFFRNKKLKIYEAEFVSHEINNSVGEIKKIINKKGFIVSLSDSDILITEVQYEGKKRMNAHDFYNGARIQIGERLTSGI